METACDQVTYRMSTQEEPRHGGKPNLVLGNNLADTVIYRERRTTDKRSSVSSCRGKPLTKQEPELDDDSMMTMTMTMMMMEKSVNSGDEKSESQ